MKIRVGILSILLVVFMVLTGFACNTSRNTNVTVADLLGDPVYNKDIRVEGFVSLLGELFCPCFHLSYGGKTIVVWYDLMIEDDGNKWPRIITGNISNGDYVRVKGQLREGSIHSSYHDFWAKEIKKLEDADVSKVRNPKEALSAILDYFDSKGITVIPSTIDDWDEFEVESQGTLGGKLTGYENDDWLVYMRYPIVLPQNTKYDVEIVGPYSQGWFWRGSIDYYGTISEEISFNKLTVDTSSGIAGNFILDSPTYKFDGLSTTLNLVETITLRCPYCWQFVFEFDSRNSGYGDRSGSIVLPVITHHQVVITVDHGQVVYALMDGKWDMLQQEIVN